MTTVVHTVSSVIRVIARSTRIDPSVSVENTAPCRPAGNPDVVGDQRCDFAGLDRDRFGIDEAERGIETEERRR